jgi:hypothetical protein
LSLPLLVLPLFTGAAFAVSPDAVVHVRGEGDAPGRGQHARREAIANACNGLLVKHLEFWSDSAQLSRLAPILDRGSNYFRDVRVLRQEAQGDVTHVEVEADLLLSKLREEVARVMLPVLGHRPRAIVIAQDDFGGESVRTMDAPGVAEQHLRKMLRRDGFEVVEPERLHRVLTPDELLACVGGADSVAAEAARALFADVAIVGRASTSIADDARLTNLIRNRASVALRIVRAEDDSIAEELHATGIVESRDPADSGPLAVEDACEKLRDAVSSAIVMAVLFAPDDEAVKLSLTGAPADQPGDDFAAWLAVQDRVDGVEIVGDEPGILRLRLDYTGTMSDLVELLEDRAALRITRVLDRNVTAAFQTGGGDFDR